MNRSIPSLLLAVSASFATVPVSFSSGTPAKADDVNKNFAALDSAIQKKADAAAVSVLQSAVSTKADQTKLDDLTKTVATKASLTELSAKKDSAWIVSTINGKLPTGTLSAANNLKDIADPAAARTNLGLGGLSTKTTLAAKDVGALDQATADARYLNTNSDTLAGALYLRPSSPLRDSTGSWLFGYGQESIGIGSAASGNGFSINLWNGTNDTAAIFAKSRIALRRTVSIAGDLPLAFTGTGSGTYDITTLYAYPPTSTTKGVYLELPLLANLKGSTPSDFEINVRGGNRRIFRYDGTADLITLPRPTKINDLTIGGSLKTASGLYKASDVADYVFEPGYKLASLSEVEAYTKEHKHLPEVPSATEIEQGGMDLAKMNLLLLKKVEELTLHTIELEKRLKAVEVSTKP